MSSSVLLKRILLLTLLFPFMASAQVFRYASPTGSATAAGTQGNPWNITRAMRACSNDTTIVLLDGIYLQDSTGSGSNWSPGTGTGRSRMIAAPGARPVFTRRNNQPPSVTPRANTTLQGIWIGGRGINDSIGTALGHNTSRSLAAGDSIIGCVIFNTWDDGIGSSQSKIVIKNSLFINCGFALNGQTHSVYFTGSLPTHSESTIVTYRNVFVQNEHNKQWNTRLRWSGRGFGLHYWHNPKYARILKNFSAERAVHHGVSVTCRDNVFWQGGIAFQEMEGVSPDSAAIDTPHVWRHNILVKHTQPIDPVDYFSWPSTTAWPAVMWWDGDSTWLSNWYHVLYPVRQFGTIRSPISFTYPDGIPTLLGNSAANIDTAVVHIGAATYDKTAQEVYGDTTILRNWQTLLNVLDFWQGTVEEPADKGGTSIQLNVPLRQGWNMITDPVEWPADSVRQIFPSAIFPYGFTFDSAVGYVPEYRMVNEKGYWVKFPAATSAFVIGNRILADSIQVRGGWNLIGSLSYTADTGHVVTVPPGLRNSVFYRYNGGYEVAATLEAGKGHWVKSSAPGTFILNGDSSLKRENELTDPLAAFCSLTIADVNGGGQTLYLGRNESGTFPLRMYEMPPPAPESVLDARFGSGRMVELYGGSPPESFLIEVRNAVSPVTVAWSVPPGGAVLHLSDGTPSGRLMAGSGSITLQNSGHWSMIITTTNETVPSRYSLSQNSPNPFNPGTNITYELPVSGQVSLQVYDLLGREVTTLVNGEQAAGTYTVHFDGTRVGSGVYFYRLQSGGLSLTRKMMMVK